MAHIGRSVGQPGAPDTQHLPIRNTLTTHPNFAQLRDALAAKGESPLTENLPRLKWLAGPSKMGGETRYALIHRGAYTVAQLARAEA
jgi:hypothetical protein